MRLALILMFFGLLFAACSEEQSTEQIPVDNDYYIDVEPTDTSNFEIANFALKLPDESENLRGILVIVPGRNTDGRDYKDWSVFSYFANVEKVAIVSCYFYGDDEDELYYKTWNGSDQVLIDVIEEFSEMAEKPELKNLPLLFWGHSAGGIYGYSFTARHPERVVACTPVRSSEFITEPDQDFRYVPMMFLLGQTDDAIWNQVCINNWNANRRNGAQWAYAIEPVTGHGLGISTTLSMPFLSNVLRLRVGNSISHYSEMIRLEETAGWLGNPITKSISRYDQYSGDKMDACWFPDSSTAAEWIEYVR